MSIPNPFRPVCGKPGGELPPGYTALEYLQSTGTQYIDTGLKPSQFDEFEVQYADTMGTDTAGNYFGVDDNVSGRQISNAITAYATSQTWFAYGNNETNPGGLIKTVTTYKVDSTTAYFTYGSTTKTCTKSGTVLDVSMYLFRANGAAAQTAYYNTGLRIYYSWMKRNGINVQQLIPALDPTGRPCMFDLVQREPYYNKGTGEFLYA